MEKNNIDAYTLLEKVRHQKPVIHHLTNWVTIYDCANVVKLLGASPVMAHAKEEVAQMTGIASALVLNIGTLDVDFVDSMKIAARSANEKGIPVVLDVCGAGATSLRDEKSFELLKEARIDIIKGNASEIARITGEDVKTKGVDAAMVKADLAAIAQRLAKRQQCTVVATGREDIVTDGIKLYRINNGDEMMTHVVGTGCMATSVIATFAAVEQDLAYAAASALVCFEIAAERAAQHARGPASFKTLLFDELYGLNERTVSSMQKVGA